MNKRLHLMGLCPKPRRSSRNESRFRFLREAAKPLLIFILLLTACGSDRIAIGPTGMPTLINPSAQADEIYDYEPYEPYEGPIESITISSPQIFETDDVLRLSMRHPMTLNPLLNEDVTVARILRLIFEPLIVLDENLRPTSHLANLEFASDLSSVRLIIRSDAYWSDGMPVTADDLIFSVTTLRNAPQNAIYRYKVENIANINRISLRAVQIYFHQSSMCAGNTLNFPIIPQHHYRNQTNPASPANMNPVGNAPFMFESHNQMHGLRLIQNPHSFRQRSQIEEIDVVFLPDAQTELYAFDQGRIDALHLPLTEWARHHSVRHINHEIFPAMYFEFIGFNFEREKFNNIQVRRGIAHAFDACQAVRDVYLNQAVRATSPIHPYSFGGGNFSNIDYDPVRAQALLRIVPVYQPIIVLVNDDNPQRVSIAERFVSSLNAVGLPATAEILPYADYFARIADGDFDMFIGGVNLAFQPDMEFFLEGGLFVEDAALQVAFSTTQNVVTESLYLQAMSQFQQNFAETLPIISLAFRHSAVLTNMRVQQNETPAPDNPFGWINLWEIR